MTESSAELVQVRYEKLKSINFTVSRITREFVHVHSSVEVGLVLDGALQVQTETRSFRADRGDLILFNAYEIHRLKPEGEPTVLFLHFAPNFGKAHFVRFVRLEFDYDPQRLEPAARAEMAELILRGAEVFFREPEVFGMECAGLACAAATKLLRSIPYIMTTDLEHMAKKKKIGRKQRIAGFLEQHYRDKLSLTQLAQAEGLTTAYMSRIFGELFCTSFQEYVSRLRLQKALPMLKKTDFYLVDICMECGFSDTRYLNAVCQKEYGCSATQLREKMQDPDWRDPYEVLPENEVLLDDQAAISALQAYTDAQLTAV